METITFNEDLTSARQGTELNWRSVEHVCSVWQGMTLSRSRDDSGDTYNVVQIKHLDKLELSGEPDAQQLNAKADNFRLESAQVVVSLRGFPIKASVVTDSFVGCVAGSNVAVLNPKQLDPYYLAGLISSRYFNRLIEGQVGGSAIPSLSVKTLRAFEIPVPQASGASFAEAFKAIDLLETTTQRLVTLREEQMEVRLRDLLGRNYA